MDERGKDILRRSLRAKANSENRKPEDYLLVDPEGFTKKFINERKGYGIFANTFFKRGEFLLHYDGELISLTEAKKREKCYAADDARHLTLYPRSYLFFFKHDGKQLCIDASNNNRRKGRIVNDDTCPNSKMKKIVVDGRPYLCLFASRDIHASEEIVYDYGASDLWWRQGISAVHDHHDDSDSVDSHLFSSAEDEPGSPEAGEEEKDETKRKKETESIREEIETLFPGRAKPLSTEEKYVSEHKHYENVSKDCEAWFEKLKKHLVSLDSTCGDRKAVESRLAKLSELQLHDGCVKKVKDVADEVKSGTSTGGKEIIQDELDKLENKWDVLLEDSLRIQQKLETTVKRWQQCTDIKGELIHLIECMEQHLHTKSTLQHTLPDKQAQFNQVQAFCKSLDDQHYLAVELQENVDLLVGAGADPAVTSGYADVLHQLEDTSVKMNSLKERCEQQCKEHAAYQKDLTTARDWLTASLKKLASCSDSQVDDNGLKINMRLLKELEDGKATGELMLTNAKREADKVVPHTAIKGQEFIQLEINNLRDQYDSYCLSLVETQGKLGSVRVEWEKFEMDLEKLLNWIREQEAIVIAYRELGYKQDVLHQQNLRKEILSKGATIDRMNVRAKTLKWLNTESVLTSQLTLLNSKYSTLMQTTKDVKEQMNDQIMTDTVEEQVGDQMFTETVGEVNKHLQKKKVCASPPIPSEPHQDKPNAPLELSDLAESNAEGSEVDAMSQVTTGLDPSHIYVVESSCSDEISSLEQHCEAMENPGGIDEVRNWFPALMSPSERQIVTLSDDPDKPSHPPEGNPSDNQDAGAHVIHITTEGNNTVPVHLFDVKIVDCEDFQSEDTPSETEDTPSETEDTPSETEDTPSETNITGITVQEINEGTEGKRDYSKYQNCYFCGQSQLKLARHLELKHKEEPEIANMPAFPKSGVERLQALRTRKKILSEIRNRGNFNHNCTVLQNKEGILYVGRKPNKNGNKKNQDDYLPCRHCLVFYLASDLWRHVKMCSFRGRSLAETNEHNQCIKEGRILLESAIGISNSNPEFSRVVIGSLQNDSISRVVKSDSLIITLGVQQYGKLGSMRASQVREKIRILGRLLITLRKLAKEPSGTLGSYIRPDAFDLCVKAAEELGEISTSEETINGTKLVKKPGLVLKCGHLLKKAALIKRGQALKSGDEQLRTSACHFLELYESEWAALASLAHTTISHRTYGSDNKKDVIPYTNDIVKLANYLDQKIRTLLQEMEEGPSNQVWRELAEATLAHLISFNCRRAVEPSRITIDVFKNRIKNPSQHNQEIVKTLKPIEQHLMKTMEVVQAVGKKNRRIHVLLTPLAVRAIESLISKRPLAGINEGNPFVFAVGSNSYLRGTSSLKQQVVSCDLERPELLTSTKMRKYLGTVAQVMNLNNEELHDLARHMGHEITVHRQYYRLQEDVLELAKVSKLLLVVEQGKAHQYNGLSIDDIQMNDLFGDGLDETEEENEPSSKDDTDSPDSPDSLALDTDSLLCDLQVLPCDTVSPPRKRRQTAARMNITLDPTYVPDDGMSESEMVNEELNDTTTSTKRKRTTKVNVEKDISTVSSDDEADPTYSPNGDEIESDDNEIPTKTIKSRSKKKSRAESDDDEIPTRTIKSHSKKKSRAESDDNEIPTKTIKPSSKKKSRAESDDDEITTKTIKPSSKKKSRAERRVWSKEEKETLRPLVRRAVNVWKPPTKEDISELLKDSQCELKQLPWTKIKFQVWAMAQQEKKDREKLLKKLLKKSKI